MKQNKKLYLEIIAFVACICIAVALYQYGTKKINDVYMAAYSAQKEETKNLVEMNFYDAAESKYHASNKVSIYIENIAEEQKLEVLDVSDVEFIIEDSADNESNVLSWLEVPGTGTFVIDLQKAEYIIDNERKHVLVRVPYPELTNVEIEYGNVQKLRFIDDVFNGSYKEGEELAKQQLDTADLLIKKEFISNQNFYHSAQEAARSTIINRVLQWNPDIEDLTVEVEFYQESE